MTISDEYTENVEPKELEKESGTAYNWLDFPFELWEQDDGTIRDIPDRTWVAEMERMIKTDGRASAVYSALTLPLRAANITLEAPEDDDGQTEFVRSNLLATNGANAMETPIYQVISQMTHAAAVARTFHELVWVAGAEGKVVIKKLAYRPPSTVEVVRHRKSGKVLHLKQFGDWEGDRNNGELDRENYYTIPGKRSVVHVHNSHRDELLGVSSMAVVKWAHDLKQKVIYLWLTFCGEQALPRTVVYGNDPTSAKRNAQMLSKLRGSGVVGITRSAENTARMFDVVEGTGSVSAASQFGQMISYLEGVQAESVMAGWLELTSAAASGKGSYALSADSSGLFLASLHGSARELADTINKQVICPLVRVNFGPDVTPPKLVFEKLSEDQVDKAMALLSTLAAAPNLNAPTGFVDLLIERVAQYLDLEDEKVAAMIKDGQEKAQAEETQSNWQKLQQLGGAVDAAVGLVQGAETGQEPAVQEEETPVKE